jgi:hypothetical protein
MPNTLDAPARASSGCKNRVGCITIFVIMVMQRANRVELVSVKPSVEETPTGGFFLHYVIVEQTAVIRGGEGSSCRYGLV